MREAVYLDYNATTPLHAAVRAELERMLREAPGNPSSLHRFGRRARDVVERARSRLARFLGVEADEIYFTSGGTESNNLIVQGLETRAAALWTSSVEHPSVREPARRRWRRGVAGGEIGVDGEGRLRLEELERADLGGALVSLQWVNNETGTIQDLAALARAAKSRGAVVHTDGAQGFFRLRASLGELGVDAASVTAHKSFGPIGVGALYLRRGLVIEPLAAGGQQERRLRPGTENLPAIHAFGVLAELAGNEELWPLAALCERRQRFAAELAKIGGLRRITPEQNSLPNTLSVCFADLQAETILIHLDRRGVLASSGSACAAGAGEPSSVLKAMGLSDHEIRGAIRFSFGPATGDAELQRAAETLAEVVEGLRWERR